MNDEAQMDGIERGVLTPAISGSASNPADRAARDLKSQTARGTLASCVNQAAGLALRVVSMVVLARLLSPEDFGLVGMVTAVTGFLALFKEAGLSNASVQSATVDQGQLSTLFWINVAFGCALAAACAASAPAVAAFYGEPRLFWITLAAGTSFIFHGLGTQHRAVLLRSMRIPILCVIEMVSLIVSIVVSIGMAAAGCGYWSLVANIIILPAGSALGVWLAAAWIPGKPRFNAGVGRMLVYGGTVTLNSVVVYIAYNADKILLGRFSGAQTLGMYGRAYGLIRLPTDGLLSAIGSVAFPALSRMQEDPARLRTFFLRIYSVLLSLTLPITMACALFAEDIVQVFLGPKWGEAAPIFRLLAPTILVFALIDPFGWLMFATGRMARSLKIALAIAAVVIPAYALGLKWGATGVAVGFSTAMVLLLGPFLFWARHGTSITIRDTFKAVMYPAGAILIASVATLIAWPWIRDVASPLVRLILANALLFGVYTILLLFAFRQISVYVDLLRQTGLWPVGSPATSKKGN